MEILRMTNGKVIQLYQYISLRGCITNANAAWGSVRELEHRLGFGAGRLSHGFFVARLTRLPYLHEFDPGGFTNTPIHKPRNYNGLDKNVIASLSLEEMQKTGNHNLIKIIPVIQHSNLIDNEIQYPPGTGIQQWNLTKEILMYVFMFVEGYRSRIPSLKWE